MTVYDVSRSPEVPVNFHVPPYSLPVPSIITSRLVGNSLFRHPGDSGDSNASFIRLSEAGAIYKVDFTFSEDQVSSSTLLKSSGFKWSPDVYSLAQSAIRRSDHGPMGARRLEEQNFSELYQGTSNDCPLVDILHLLQPYFVTKCPLKTLRLSMIY